MDIPYLSLLGLIAVGLSVAFMVWAIWARESIAQILIGAFSCSRPGSAPSFADRSPSFAHSATSVWPLPPVQAPPHRRLHPPPAPPNRERHRSSRHPFQWGER